MVRFLKNNPEFRAFLTFRNLCQYLLMIEYLPYTYLINLFNLQICLSKYRLLSGRYTFWVILIPLESMR